MDNIQKIYKMLNWKNTEDVIAEGLRLAESIEDLSLLIFPPAPPSVWENCARILHKKSDTELEPYLDGLLEWIRDLNWPGAQTILNRLKSFSGQKLKSHFIDAFYRAKEFSNNEGLAWLDYLSELLDNEELADELSYPIIEELQKHYDNQGSRLDE